MDKVIAWVFVALFATVVVTDAYALTLKSGEVLTSNGVVHATESANTQARVTNDGYAVVAGLVIIGVGEELVTVELSELRGKSRTEIVSVIGEAAATQLDESVSAQITVAAQEVHSEVSEDLVNLLGEDGVAQMLADEASGGSCPECTLSNADFAAGGYGDEQAAHGG